MKREHLGIKFMQFRYPFYASELLSCETPKVVDSFFPKEE